MMNARNSQIQTHVAQRTDQWEFHALLALAVGCFFVVSLLTRLLPRSIRPFAAPADRRESCFEEARRMAYAVIPYAFEW